MRKDRSHSWLPGNPKLHTGTPACAIGAPFTVGANPTVRTQKGFVLSLCLSPLIGGSAWTHAWARTYRLTTSPVRLFPLPWSFQGGKKKGPINIQWEPLQKPVCLLCAR